MSRVAARDPYLDEPAWTAHPRSRSQTHAEPALTIAPAHLDAHRVGPFVLEADAVVFVERERAAAGRPATVCWFSSSRDPTIWSRAAL